jgi:hypothetical protein
LKKRILAWLSGALLLALSVPVPAALIVHNPVLSAVAGRPVQIDATLTGAKAPVAAVLFYRPRGKELYQSVVMNGSEFEVSASITGTAVTTEGLEYYIEVDDASGKAFDPAVNPQLNPHFVSVREAMISANLTVLSPAEGDIVETGRPVISVAFTSGDTAVDASAVVLEIDGKPVTDRENLQIYSTLFSYIPGSPLAEGTHQMHVGLKDGTAGESDTEWTFTVQTKVAGEKLGERQRNWAWSGGLKLETQYAGLSQQPDPTMPSPGLIYRPYGTNRATLDVTGRGPRQIYQMHVYKTDEERDDQQAVDRYVASMTYDESSLHVGDYSPNFSELSLNNLYFLRGVTLDLNSGNSYESHSRLVAVGGQTRRGIDFGAAAQVSGTAVPSYYQYLYGARYEFTMTKFLQWGLNSVTVNDDSSNLTGKAGVNPTNNWMTTSDMTLRIPYFTLDGEAGAGWFLSDPYATSLSLGTAYKTGGHLNILPWSTKADFEFRDMGGGWGGLFSASGLPITLPGGYTDAANPSLLTDYRGFESSFAQSILDSRASLNLTYNGWRNNLQGIQPYTTQTNYVAGFLNLNPMDTLFLNGGYSVQTQVNDAASNTLGAINNAFGNFTGTIGYSKALPRNFTVNGTFSAVAGNFTQQNDILLAPNFNSGNLTLSLFLGHGVDTLNGAVSQGNTYYQGVPAVLSGTAQVGYASHSSNYTARYSRSFLEGRTTAFAGWDFNASSTDEPFASDSERTTYSLGAGWAVTMFQRFDLSLAFAQVTLGNITAAIPQSNAYSQSVGNLSYHLTF